MEAISKVGHDMSLAALKQNDPYINRIIDVTGQVALYTFNSKANEWEKTDIEGTLFVYARSASPYHGFTIMNRLNMKNLVEPINKDLEFQLQDPFLLYRNSNLSIYSIWFYDKNDCQRIAQLMSQVVKQEIQRAKQASPDGNIPSKSNGCAEERPIDILEMLSKAKDEYERNQAGESDVASSTEFVHNCEPLKSTAESAEHLQSLSQQEKLVHPGPKQITIEELFGSSLPKEQNLMSFPNQNATEPSPPDSSLQSHSFVPPFPFEPVLMPRVTADKVMGMQQAHMSSPLLVCHPASEPLNPSPQVGTQPVLCPPAAGSNAVGMSFVNQDFLHKLKTPSQQDQLQQPVLHKPALAPSFLPSHSHLATPECFKEPVVKPGAFNSMPVAPIQSLPQNKEVDVFAQSKSISNTLPVVPMQAVSAVSGVEPSVLLSPSVFQQAAAKPTETEIKLISTSPLTLGPADPPTSLPTALFSKTQLQDALIHLLKLVFMEDYHKPDQQTLQTLRNIANRLRINSIKATTAAGSGHPSSCCSAAEIMSVLFFHTMKYKPEDPRNPNNDRFVLSKGHAAPVLYAVWAEAGYLRCQKKLILLCSPQYHESWCFWKQQFVDVATGSLGQGLGAACGMAYTGKYFDKARALEVSLGSSTGQLTSCSAKNNLSHCETVLAVELYRVYCLLGDGELSEGAVWEAMAFASFYQLDNLVAILDINRLGQSDPTPLQHQVEKYQRRCEAFGWNAIVVDGHSVEELCKVFCQAKHQPTAIIAKTIKGKGIPVAEDKLGWHGKPLPKDVADAVLKELHSRILNNNKRLCPALPIDDVPSVNIRNIRMPSPPSYKPGEKIATRKAYGVALAKLGRSSDRVIALDGDTKNSTFSEIFKNEHPSRYIECYIAEQNMVGVAVGCAARDRTVAFASTFATFFTRAYDQIRMAAISESNINLVGSHCGVSIGEDGPSQMGLEDLAMFRAIPTATVFYPCDGVSTEKAVELAANTKGICFIRTSRPENTVIYNNNEDFRVGQAKVVYQSKDDHVTVIGAGVTLHEALSAAEQLKKERINIRVIDPFTIKPLDAKTILEHGKATRGRILTVEDHYYEGGIGEAVAAAVAGEPGVTVHRLAVSHVPRSGKPAELLKIFGIDKDAIIQAVKKMLSGSTNAK
ncbi:TKT Transketolase, partial [Atractosteus spatula]|nr:TKT Transketolase [Atractosteus spatula]